MTLQSIPEGKFSDDVMPSLKHPRVGQYPPNNIPKLDYDSNGWLQSKRDLAANLIAQANAVHITGEFEDGFGNKMTLHAAAKPFDIDREPARLHDKAVGCSIITLHREDGSVTLANWPYYSCPTTEAPDNQPYTNWPITIDPKTNKRLK